MPKGRTEGFGDDQYRGGSVPGHAATNPGGTVWALPKHDMTRHQFGQPGGSDPRGGPGRAATAKQRLCLEAIERGEPDSKLLKRGRFPAGMVKRLRKMHDIACDPEHRFCAQFQRLVYEILITAIRKEDKEADAAARREPEVIEVKVGRLEVPMPGAPGDVPPDADAKAG